MFMDDSLNIIDNTSHYFMIVILFNNSLKSFEIG